jgi:hypothetical protein
MNGAPALSLVLAANSLESVLVVVLVILAALVVIAIVGALVMLMRRRRPDESAARVASTAPVPPLAPPPAPAVSLAGARDEFAPRPPVGPPASTPAPVSLESPTSSLEPPATTAEPQATTPQAQPAASPAMTESAESAQPETTRSAAPEPASAAAGSGQPEPADSTGPARPEPPDVAPVKLQVVPPLATPAPEAEQEGSGEPAVPQAISTTQTPDDVDHRSPAELAAAAQAAGAAEDRDETADGGSQAGVAMQPGPVVGPPRPIVPAAPPDPARLRMLGLTLGMLTERMRREHPPQLGTALARLVDSDQEGARSQLSTLALSLLGEDEEPSTGDGQLGLFLEEAVEGEMQRGFSLTSMPEFQQALSAVAPELHEKLQTIVWARNADSVAILTTEDVEALERVAMAMATALILDTSYDVRRLPGEAPSGRS